MLRKKVKWGEVGPLEPIDILLSRGRRSRIARNKPSKRRMALQLTVELHISLKFIEVVEVGRRGAELSLIREEGE